MFVENGGRATLLFGPMPNDAVGLLVLKEAGNELFAAVKEGVGCCMFPGKEGVTVVLEKAFDCGNGCCCCVGGWPKSGAGVD